MSTHTTGIGIDKWADGQAIVKRGECGQGDARLVAWERADGAMAVETNGDPVFDWQEGFYDVWDPIVNPPNTVTLSDGRSFTLPDRDKLIDLLAALQSDIGDDYRILEDPEDGKAGMFVTIGASLDGSWSWQTGDNSFMGGAYHHPHWGVGYLYRDSNVEQIADGMLDEIAEGMAQTQHDGLRKPTAYGAEGL